MTSSPAPGKKALPRLPPIKTSAPDVPLKNISLTIKPGERIGIVGRTGSGKSTLVSALYRLNEPAEGRIVIDGIDTNTIGVSDLRSKLSIIPQEPQLFVGNVRYNIDPFDAFSDEEIWEALRIAGLKDFVSTLDKKLEEPVKENGSNFSVGQRQLFCLARALLRKSRILVLDEATASVDFDTDILIQKALRTSFPNTTLLVIAHRLNTVMDMNRILALEKGELMEFKSPAELIADKKSLLYGMVQATGKATAKHLKDIATGKIDVFKSFEVLRSATPPLELAATPEVEEREKSSKAKKSKKESSSSSSSNGAEKPKKSESKSSKKSSSSEKKIEKKPSPKKEESSSASVELSSSEKKSGSTPSGSSSSA